MARGASEFPAWTHSVGAMKAAQAEKPAHYQVHVACDRCKQWRSVDLDGIIAARSPTFALINRRYRCKLTPGCQGWNRFRYQSGVMRPLWTEKQAERWSLADYARQRLEKAGRDRVADLLRGRHMRFDPAPQGIDPVLWALADDRERRQLMRQVRG